jgi:FKBP-type peptidyl-prolyl cis-trans isomerase FkpA
MTIWARLLAVAIAAVGLHCESVQWDPEERPQSCAALASEPEWRCGGAQASAICQAQLSRLFWEASARRPNYTRTTTGVLFEVLREGNGISADSEGWNAMTHFTIRLSDGDEVLTTHDTGLPDERRVHEFIPGVREVLLRSRVGQKIEIIVPPDQAYGVSGDPAGKIPPCSLLVWEVEVLDFWASPESRL